MTEGKGLQSFIAVLLLAVAAPLVAAGVPEDELTKYGRGIIEDYSDMEHGQLEWVWVAPGVKISDYSIDVGEFENMSGSHDGNMMEALNDGMQKAFQRVSTGSKKGKLSTQNTVYWAERANSAKRWIPFAGSHVAQAGLGIEMVFRDADGNIVAKVRHSGREGERLSDPAWELIDEIADWAQGN